MISSRTDSMADCVHPLQCSYDSIIEELLPTVFTKRHGVMVEPSLMEDGGLGLFLCPDVHARTGQTITIMEGTLYDHSKAKLLVNQQYLRTLSNQSLVLDGVRAIDIPDGRGAASAANHGAQQQLFQNHLVPRYCTNLCHCGKAGYMWRQRSFGGLRIWLQLACSGPPAPPPPVPMRN